MEKGVDSVRVHRDETTVLTINNLRYFERLVLAKVLVSFFRLLNLFSNIIALRLRCPFYVYYVVDFLLDKELTHFLETRVLILFYTNV